MNKKYITSLLMIIILISNITALSAYENNDNNLLDKINSIKEDLLNHEDKIEVKVHNYSQLKKTIEEYNMKNDNNSYIIILEDGDYNITDAILYRCKSPYKQDLTIEGNGHIIDGNNKKRFMHFDNCNITFKNIIVKNTLHDDKNHAGVFEMISPSNLNVTNCTFINNEGDQKGSVITNRGNTTVTDSVFINNTANHVGGAIWSTGQYNGQLNLTNNTFKENTANKNDNNERTAIIYMVSGGLNIIDKNSFINNSGRCIHCYNYTNTNITNNYFHQNSLNDSNVIRGGVIDNYESDISITNNTFDKDTSNGELRGGILYHEIGYLNFSNNTVENIHKQTDVTSTAYCSKGGVIFNRNATGVIKDNIFKNVITANLSRGCVIYNNMGNLNIENNEFKNTAIGYDIRGVVAYTDVAGILKLKNNSFDSNVNGSIIAYPEEDKNIYNSNQPMAESSNKRGIVNYN